MAKSPHLSRNDFVKGVVGIVGMIMGVVVGLPAIGFILSPALKIRSVEAWVPLGNLDDYPVGTPTLFSFTRTTVNGWEKTTNSYGVYVYRKRIGNNRFFKYMHSPELQGGLASGFSGICLSLPRCPFQHRRKC
jgi:hypothetical protein